MKVQGNFGISQQNNEPAREIKNQMGKDEFLKILIVQLQNQDPLQPMEDREFIAQMAQFSALEQMQNMSRDFESVKAMSLVGKMVYGEAYIDKSSNIIPILGRVDSVTFANGKTLLQVGNFTLPLEDMMRVFSEEEAKKISETD